MAPGKQDWCHGAGDTGAAAATLRLVVNSLVLHLQGLNSACQLVGCSRQQVHQLHLAAPFLVTC